MTEVASIIERVKRHLICFSMSDILFLFLCFTKLSFVFLYGLLKKKSVQKIRFLAINIQEMNFRV